MCRVLTGVLLVTLAVITLQAQDEPRGKSGASKASEEWRKLKKEFDAAMDVFFGVRNELVKQLQATKDEAERKKLEKKLKTWQERLVEDRPNTKFGPRLLQFAEENPTNPAGVEALELVLRDEYRFWDGVKDMGKLWGQAVAVLQKEYIAVPEVKRLLPYLTYSGDAASEKFVHAVLEKCPDRLTQARAAQALADASERAAAFAAHLN